MRKVRILNWNCLLQEMARMKRTAGRRQGPGSPKQLSQAKRPSRLMLWGSQLRGWPRPDREHPDITVPHPWGQTLEGSHVEGGLGLLTSWKLDTTKNTWGY